MGVGSWLFSDRGDRLKREDSLARGSIQAMCGSIVERRREEIHRPKTSEHERREICMNCKIYLKKSMQF